MDFSLDTYSDRNIDEIHRFPGWYLDLGSESSLDTDSLDSSGYLSFSRGWSIWFRRSDSETSTDSDLDEVQDESFRSHLRHLLVGI